MIDEWDCGMRERQESEGTQRQYLDSARKDYLLIRELPAGKGFADVAFLPLPHTNRPALIVELKYDRSAQGAIRQIKDRRYTQAFEQYRGEILLVGISYDKDKKEKPHCCVIEKWEKG